jgi:hypothetical protein
MPCRHIASVCLGNDTILGPNPLGFPLSSIRVFWWNQYYLYGMSEKGDHQKIRVALLALADNDTQGLPCPSNLDKPIDFHCPDSVITLFHLPATDRILNYDSSTATHAAQSMKDRNNPHQLLQQVPAGLYQLSHLPSQENGDGNDWNFGIEELSVTEDYSHSRKVLSRHYNDVTEAIHNSSAKEAMENELKELLNSMTVRARAHAFIPSSSKDSSSKGKSLSMIPASSKRRKTHGTKHY